MEQPPAFLKRTVPQRWAKPGENTLGASAAGAVIAFVAEPFRRML